MDQARESWQSWQGLGAHGSPGSGLRTKAGGGRHMEPDDLWEEEWRKPPDMSEEEFERYLYEREEQRFKQSRLRTGQGTRRQRAQEGGSGDEAASEDEADFADTVLPGVGAGKKSGNGGLRDAGTAATSAGHKATKDKGSSGGKLTMQMLRRRQNETSSFLRCLAQLDDDAWMSVLLPMLSGAGAAGSLALTCTWLRRLIQRNCRVLDFTSTRMSSTTVFRSQTSTLPSSFPNCTEVHLELCDSTGHRQAAVLLPVLARLPKLGSMVLRAPSGCAHDSPLAVIFCLIEERLTQLRKLTINSSDTSCWLHATEAFQDLVSIRQLTSLHLNLGPALVRLADFSLLDQLTALQDLRVDAVQARWDASQRSQEQDLYLAGPFHDHGGGWEQEEGEEDGQPAHEQHGQQQALGQAAGQMQERARAGLYFLQHLTVLTSLIVTLPTHTGFECVGNCQQLKYLRNTTIPVPGAAARAEPWLSTIQCGALASLTCLTGLMCGGIKQADMRVFYAALKHLRHLEALSIAPGTQWTLDALPVLASLTRLTELAGAWQQEDAAPGSSKIKYCCGHVTCMWGLAGAVPFSAFKQLEQCEFSDSISVAALASMARHCQCLTAFGSLDAKVWRIQSTTLPKAAPGAARISAIKSLSRLSSTLKRITFHAQDDCELAFLMTAAERCQALGSTVLVVARGTRLTACGLMHLTRRRAPKHLTLLLPGLDLKFDDAVALLVGLSPDTKLSISVRTDEQLDAFFEAVEHVEELGVAVPQFGVGASLLAVAADLDDEEDEGGSFG